MLHLRLPPQFSKRPRPAVGEPNAPDKTAAVSFAASGRASSASALPRSFLVFLAAFTLLFLRRPTNLTRPQFWAEDGAIFFCEQLIYGSRALFHSYAGYSHLLPRLIAVVAYWFDAIHAPFLYALLSIVVAALCCTVFSLDFFQDIVSSRSLRICMCLLATVVPQCDECIGNVANLQWWLLIPGALFAIRPLAGRHRSLILYGVAGAAIALTAPGLVVVLPFTALYFWKRRRLTAYQIGLTLGLLAQILIVLNHPSSDPKIPVLVRFDQTVTATLHALGNQIFLTAVLGHKWANQLVNNGYLSAGLLATVGLCTAVAVSCRTPVHLYRSALAASFSLLLGSLALAIWFRAILRDIFQSAGHFMNLMGDRYFLFPSCLLVFIAALLIIRWTEELPGTRLPILLLCFGTGLVFNFRVRPLEDLHWAQYAPEIRQWRAQHLAHQPGASLKVPINPKDMHIVLPAPDQSF